MLTVTRVSKHPLRYVIDPVSGDWTYEGLVKTPTGQWKPKLRWSPAMTRKNLRQCGDCRFLYTPSTEYVFHHECKMGMPVAVKPGCLFATYCQEFDE